jgi:hypothetical protein
MCRCRVYARQSGGQRASPVSKRGKRAAHLTRALVPREACQLLYAQVRVRVHAGLLLARVLLLQRVLRQPPLMLLVRPPLAQLMVHAVARVLEQAVVRLWQQLVRALLLLVLLLVRLLVRLLWRAGQRDERIGGLRVEVAARPRHLLRRVASVVVLRLVRIRMTRGRPVFCNVNACEHTAPGRRA